MLLKKIDTLYSEVISANLHNYDGSQNRHEFRIVIEYLSQRLAAIEEEEVCFFEIGAFKGLWALAFNILCEHHEKKSRYVTVTWVSQDANNRDIFSTQQYFRDHGGFFELIDGNSAQPETITLVKKQRDRYHMVFIDGDHSFKGVMQDIKNYAPLAIDTLMFHDINTRDCGVRKAIEKSKITLNIEVSYGDIMGIGIKDCKIYMPYVPRSKPFLGLF